MIILATPQSDSGQIDEENLENHVEYIITEGLAKGEGVIVTTGSMRGDDLDRTQKGS